MQYMCLRSCRKFIEVREGSPKTTVFFPIKRGLGFYPHAQPPLIS